MIKVLMTGATGLVGAHILALLKSNFVFLTPNSLELDITNAQKTKNYVRTHDFDIFLHLAAYTNVDKAETEKELCYRINVTGTQNVLTAVQEKNKQFMLISTDFVFDGKQEQYDETSKPNPISYYGQTKFLAEQMVKDKAMIIRLSYPYGISSAPKPDFVRNIIALMKKEGQIAGVTDSLITPTYLDDIANGLKYLLNNYKPQLYHLVGSESLSPYQTFLKIAVQFDLNQDLIKPTTYEQYFLNKAKRPKNGKIISRYQLVPNRSFTDGLKLVKELSGW